MFNARNVFGLLVLVLSSLFLAPMAFAWVGVGDAPDCEVDTVQKAIDRIMDRQRGGDYNDPLIVISGGTYNEQLHIHNPPPRAVLTIVGGYDAHCSGPATGAVAIIDATNHLGSVLTVDGDIQLSLQSLWLTGANNTNGNGGAISFNGTGFLTLNNVAIYSNHAGHGGGIYANGNSGGLVVDLQSTEIMRNSAEHAGGGVSVQGQTKFSMADGNSSIHDNTVIVSDSDGNGGGIQVVGPARIQIGSGEITGNIARYGGGIAVNNSGNNSGYAAFYMSVADRPTRVLGNKASMTGGGIYLAGAQRATACGYGLKIENNVAQEGAGIYLDTGNDVGAEMYIGSADLQSCGGGQIASALPCAAGSVCNTINGNRAQNMQGNPTGGSAVLLQSVGFFAAHEVELRGNSGQSVIRGFRNRPPSFSPVDVSNCVIAQNLLTGDVIRMEENGGIQLSNCTFASNFINAGSKVLSLTGNLTLTESLVWQPGITVLQQDGGHQRNVLNVLANEVDSLGIDSSVMVADPQFVQPFGGDFHLKPTSPALDFARTVFGTDIEGHTRTIDLPERPNRSGGGARDLGAYERGTGVFPPDEIFENVTVPALPQEWINTHTGVGDGWVTVPPGGAIVTKAAFADDTAMLSDKSLETPPFNVALNGRVTFHHRANLECCATDGLAFDAAVLEISIAGAPFVDIIDAGGSFVSGGYDRTVSPCCLSALANRRAWSSNPFQSVIANLPAAANRQSVRLRWRVATDFTFANASGGYWLDDVHVDLNRPPANDSIFADDFDPLH